MHPCILQSITGVVQHCPAWSAAPHAAMGLGHSTELMAEQGTAPSTAGISS